MISQRMVLDVLEATVLNLRPADRKGAVRLGKLHSQLRRWQPVVYQNLTTHDVRRALKEVYPIRKNRRSRTVRFQTSRAYAQRFCAERGIVLRPQDDAERSQLGRIVIQERG